MLRAVVGSSLCAVALVGTAGAASAGEITGNGRFKPVNGTSICAYSGQNDGSTTRSIRTSRATTAASSRTGSS